MAQTASDRKSRLKVLFVTRKWPPAVGGMEVYSREMVRELRELVDLETLVLPGRANGQPPRITSLMWFFLRCAAHICIRGRRYDVIHLGDVVLFPLLALARLAAPRSRRIVSAHGGDVAFDLRPGWVPAIYGLYTRCLGLLANCADTVIANSRATAEHCRRHRLRRVTVVPLGARAPHGDVTVDTVDLVLIFIGRVTKNKGLGWFINHVMPMLPAPITIKVVGTIWDQEEEEIISGSPRVEFIGPLYDEQLTALRRRCLAVIMPNLSSGYEGFGLTAVESAAEGIPVLASAFSGLRDSIRDGETGFLLPPDQPQPWADKIVELSQWPASRRQAFAQRAKRAVRQYYSWELVAARTVSAYAESCSSPATTAGESDDARDRPL